MSWRAGHRRDNVRRRPNYKMIQHLAAECRMPLCYGGGVRTVEQAKQISASASKRSR